MILLRKGRGMRKMAEEMFVQFGIRPGRVIETENIHIANSLSRLNRGFTLVPDFAAHRFFYADDESVYCSVKGAHLERSMYACTRQGDYRTEAERYLLELVASAPSARDEL